MAHTLRSAAGLIALFALIACAPGDPLDQSGAVFEGISPDAAITLTGTEPFWGMEISPGISGDYTARFASPSGDINDSAFVVSRFAGNNGLGFSGTLDTVSVTVAITPGDCSDGMSDRTYPFGTTVGLGDTTLLGCAYTSDAPFTGPQSP